ncbi:hypothetical protein [Neoroseomonas rubea]|uniref:hypothetical protein n=1 Tax=Neoroseomonas rubea TaxID=2748666 RepID=UPI0018DFEFDC|nr:hypothetical protein [Roseomonas rubea]
MPSVTRAEGTGRVIWRTAKSSRIGGPISSATTTSSPPNKHARNIATIPVTEAAVPRLQYVRTVPKGREHMITLPSCPDRAMSGAARHDRRVNRFKASAALLQRTARV